MLFLFIAFIAPYPGFCLPGDPNNIRFLRLFVNTSVILLSQQNKLMLTKFVHMLTNTLYKSEGGGVDFVAYLGYCGSVIQCLQ